MENLIVGNRYLFDTCVYIDLLRNRQVAKNFHYDARFLRIFVGYSIISETELWQGIKGLRTESEHIKILRVYHRYFINVTIARNAGKYWRTFKSENKQLPMADCIIAATAKFYDLRLLTRDKHMVMFNRFSISIDEYDIED